MTLVEVLVSLGIMSIGVITIATLFPLSVLRTVQATQLTSATIHRYNVEGLIAAIPDIVHDPDQNGNSGEHAETVYVVDPQGFARYGADAMAAMATVPAHTTFGFDASGAAATSISRFGFNAVASETGFDNATAFVSSPDTWIDVLEEDGVVYDGSAMPATVTFASDLSAVNVGDRIVFFHDNGRASEIRSIAGPATVANPVELDRPLPTGFVVATARIETYVPQYTWLLTVRNRGGVAGVTAAIFFNRGLAVEDEFVYSGTGGNNAFSNGSANVAITYTSGTDPDPAIKPGGYVLDASNLFWYRIARVVSDDDAGNVVLELAETAKANSDAAMFPPQLVEVYPIDAPTP